MVNVLVDKLRSRNLEGPGFLSPRVRPPAGPKLGVARICGDDIECLRPRRCNIVGTEGDASGSTESANLLAAPVFKLNKLGFFLAFSGGGLIKDGDAGSDAWNVSGTGVDTGLRFKARLLRFLNRRGEGEVIGRSSLSGGRIKLFSFIFNVG
jgi:hypothetical protein